MTSQASLFDTEEKARRRKTDPITSFWAAQGVDVTRSEGLVLNAFIKGPGTSHQLYARIREQHHMTTPQRVRTALTTLRDKGLVETVPGEYGPSENGGKSQIWRRK